MDLFPRRKRERADSGLAGMTKASETRLSSSDVPAVVTDARKVPVRSLDEVARRQVRSPRPTRATSSNSTGVLGTRFYNSAANNRLTVGLPSVPMSADQVVRRNRKTLVARSRYEIANNDYASKAMKLFQRNVVGPNGFQLKAQIMDGENPDEEANLAFETAWKAWSAYGECDVTGTLSRIGLENLFLRSAGSDGDALFIEHIGKAAGNRWGYALQAVDSELLDVEHNRQLENGNWVRMGIEYNKANRPVAYWLIEPDPRQSMLTYGYAGRKCSRYPAEAVIHGFIQDRPMQSRGIPWLATGLLRFATIEGAEDASLVNFRIGASKLGWIKQLEEGAKYEGDDQGAVDEDEPDRPRDTIVDADIGSFGYLPKGMGVEKWDPAFPNGEYAPFVKRALQGVSTGAELPYPSIGNDLEGINYSSIRWGALEARATYEALQVWMSECMCQRVVNRWLEVQLLLGNLKTPKGALDPRKIDKYRSFSLQPNRWGWVDPLKEVQADGMAYDYGQVSLTEICSKRGRDFNDVVKERQREIKIMQAAGIPLPQNINEQLTAQLLAAKE